MLAYFGCSVTVQQGSRSLFLPRNKGFIYRDEMKAVVGAGGKAGGVCSLVVDLKSL